MLQLVLALGILQTGSKCNFHDIHLPKDNQCCQNSIDLLVEIRVLKIVVIDCNAQRKRDEGHCQGCLEQR